MNLCIDIGNSMIKIAVFSGQDLLFKKQQPSMDSREISNLASSYPEIKNTIICSVRETGNLAQMVREHFPSLIIFDENTPLPFENLYLTGSTLGKDRLAAVAGANNIYPDRNVLVIDAGTAITFDLIDEQNRYLGGNISPGLMMRFRALHEFTERLPLLKPTTGVPFLAKKTEDAIAAGVQNGIIFEIESYADRLSEQFSDLIVIFTGGDAKFFDKKLKSTIFADPDLILTGLNRILTYNVKKK